MVNELEEIMQDLENVIQKLKDNKGEERTPYARAIAVTITMLEKAVAYFVYYVLQENAK